MFFEPEIYLYNLKENKESSIKITGYNCCFKNGILICHELLYYLIVGNYYENLKNISKEKTSGLSFTYEDGLHYEALKRLFDCIKNNIEDVPPLFITPHIFTKFIHLLWDKKIEERHYKKILDLLKEEFGYIQEEEIKKEEMIDFDKFKSKYLGISETSLLILKDRRNHPCILSLSGKILTEYKDKEDFLCVSFYDMLSLIKSEEIKNKL